MNIMFQIIQTNNTIIDKLYKLSVQDCILGHKNWVSIENDYGFSEIFDKINLYMQVLFKKKAKSYSFIKMKCILLIN